jgi:hypothetical protein
MFRQDPGPCPICGAAHCACGGAPTDVIVQLPQRDAARASSDPPLGSSAAPAGVVDAGGSALHATAQSKEPPAELAVPVVDPEPAPFTTSSYKKPRHLPPPNRGADR